MPGLLPDAKLKFCPAKGFSIMPNLRFLAGNMPIWQPCFQEHTLFYTRQPLRAQETNIRLQAVCLLEVTIENDRDGGSMY